MIAGLHSASLAFAQTEVVLARQCAKRAMQHLDAVKTLDIPEVKKLAHATADQAVKRYRAALGKRAFELRQLL